MLGRDVRGHPIIGDLAQMPHLLIAGASGSGTTVCVNAILASLLYRHTPKDLRLILIDPKMVEMQHYKNLPHLLAPVITDSKKVPLALGWVISEMEKRFQLFAKVDVRNITAFNSATQKSDKLPFIVVIVDELADLMVTVGKDFEMAISRLTALGRAAGIHLVVATQRPSVNVVTGVIKANIPARIAFQVASMQDSRVILDSPGAEKLLGKGDMLYEPGSGRGVRAQGVLVLDKEINRIVDFIGAKAKPKYDPELEQKLKRGPGVTDADDSDLDEQMIEQCIEVIRQSNKASVSVLQRRLRIGYTRASKIMDVLEERGIVGPNRGAEPREILDEELIKKCKETISPIEAAATKGVGDMVTYIALLQFTDQGSRNVNETTRRAVAMSEMAAELGITVVDVVWTLGQYDIVMKLEAPNDESLTSFTLKLRFLGNVTIQTMRAFRSEEMDDILNMIK